MNDIKTKPSPFTGEHGGAARLDVPDFTHHDDEGGAPWFANLQIEYVPREEVIETDSIAEYFDNWRDEKISPNDAVQKICKEISDACTPMAINIAATYRNRGGVTLNLHAKYVHPDARQGGSRIMTPGHA